MNSFRVILKQILNSSSERKYSFFYAGTPFGRLYCNTLNGYLYLLGSSSSDLLVYG
jgi:hypothetical protein